MTSGSFGSNSHNSHYSKQISKWNDTVFHHKSGIDTSLTRDYRDQEQSNHLSITSSRSSTASLSPAQRQLSSGVNTSPGVLNNTTNTCLASSSLDDKFSELPEVTEMKDASSSVSPHNVMERLDSLVLGKKIVKITKGGWPRNQSHTQYLNSDSF